MLYTKRGILKLTANEQDLKAIITSGLIRKHIQLPLRVLNKIECVSLMTKLLSNTSVSLDALANTTRHKVNIEHT